MKAILQKFGALSLAFLVLFSTLSFTVDMHYCGKTLVDLSLDKADNCLMKSMMPDYAAGCAKMQKMPCCTDVQITFEGQDELKINFDQFGFDQQVFLVAFTYAYIELFQPAEEYEIPFDGYPPPLLVKDLQLLHESFLI